MTKTTPDSPGRTLEQGNAAPSRRVVAFGRIRRRRGYVLIIVLGLAVVAFSVGTAYMEAHSTVLPEAENLMASSRAAYLAGSGVDIACHYLLYPPDSVADGDYWLGAKGLRVDSSNDYVSISVRQDASNPKIFQIDSFGLARDQDGDLRGKRGVRARVMMRPDPLVVIPYAIQCGGTLTGPSSLNVKGDMYSQGVMTCTGTCTGTASSSLSVVWLNILKPPAAIKAPVALVETPTIDVSLYSEYVLDGNTYTAYQFESNSMSASDAGTVNGLLDADMANNPGRIVVVPSGTFELEAGVNLHCTLVVDGNLCFKDSGSYQLTAVANYPAVVCAGSILIKSNTSNIVIYGTTMCEEFNLNGKKDITFTNEGAVVATHANPIVSATGSNVNITTTYNSHYAQYYDFSKTMTPFTVLRWSDY